MNFLSIDEIFSENDRIHSELEALLRNVGDAHVSKMVDGEKWTVQQVVEHIAIVDEGASKICHKLLSRARDAGSTASDSLVIGDKFMSGAAEIDQIKVEAPERVRPTGKIRIADSLNRMEDNRRRLCEIKPMFEAY